MKKIFTLFALVFCLSTAASAQTFYDGANILSATVGLGGDMGAQFTLNYEGGVADLGRGQALGMGFSAGLSRSSEEFYFGDYKYNNYYAAAMANYHFATRNYYDFYAGLRLGCAYAEGSTTWDTPSYETSYGDTYSASTGAEFIYAVYVGGRYYFSDHFAANAELGFGMVTLSVGVTYMF